MNHTVAGVDRNPPSSGHMHSSMKRLSGQPLSTAAPWEWKGKDTADGVLPLSPPPIPSSGGLTGSQILPPGESPVRETVSHPRDSKDCPRGRWGSPRRRPLSPVLGYSSPIRGLAPSLILRSHPDGFPLGEGSKYEVTNRKKYCRQNQEKLHRLLNLWVKGFPPTCAQSGDFSSPGMTVTHACTMSHLQRKRTNQPHDVAPEMHGTACEAGRQVPGPLASWLGVWA